MTRQAAHLGPDRPLLRGICLVVKGDSAKPVSGRPLDPVQGQRPTPAGTVTEFPRRPGPAVLSEAIPLFFIGRNGRGLWIAREAEGRIGGMFLLRHSAMRFAERNSAPIGCATMLLADHIELDIENRGNPLAAWLDAALRRAAALIPAYPPPIPIARNRIFGERR
jgi:hypothetical protein